MKYVQHRLLAEILEPWLEPLGQDEFSEFMDSLLRVYSDGDMLDEKQQDYLAGILLDNFRAIEFDDLFEYHGLSLSGYKRRVRETVERLGKYGDGIHYYVGKDHEDRVEEAREVLSQLPNWMVTVQEAEIPDWVLEPKYPTKAKVARILEQYEPDDDVTAVIQAFYKELT